MSPSVEQLHTADAYCSLSRPEYNPLPESSVIKGFVPLFKKSMSMPNTDCELCTLCRGEVNSVCAARRVFIEVLPLVELTLLKGNVVD